MAPSLPIALCQFLSVLHPLSGELVNRLPTIWQTEIKAQAVVHAPVVIVAKGLFIMVPDHVEGFYAHVRSA